MVVPCAGPRARRSRDGTYSASRLPPHDGNGPLHFAFAIPHGSDGEWETHLLTSGITIESTVTWPRGGRSLYFRDPDNHMVELLTPGVWETY